MPSLRSQAETQALEQRAQHAEALFEGFDDAVFVHDLDGRILDANPAASRRLGYSRAELLRMSTRDIDDPAFASGFERRLQEQVTQGRLTCEGCHVAKDGRRIPVDINTSFIEIDGKPAVLAVMRDLTQRKRAERRLAAQYAVTRVLADATTLHEAAPRLLQAIGEGLDWVAGALWCEDAHEPVLRPVGCWHAAAARADELEAATAPITLGRDDDIPGQTWTSGQPLWISDLHRQPHTARAGHAVRGGLASVLAFPICAGDHAVGVVEFFAPRIAKPDAELLSMLGALGSQVGQFIVRRRVEQQEQRMHGLLMQSEKLASIGLLSAGVAHEINNPLAYVSNNLVVLERDFKGLRDLLHLYEGARPQLEAATPELIGQADALAAEIDLPYIRDNLDRILKRTREGVERITKIVQGLRSLARTDRPKLEQASLSDLIDASLEMVRGRMQRSGIELEVSCQPVPRLRCVGTQIGQVILNLLVNAVQAVEARPVETGGKVSVTLTQAGKDIVIEVADNGCGIDPKDVARIFDPFYTSKPVGEGTGLGLALSHNIVAGHGGRIEVDSRPGEGSRFRVVLPLEAPRGNA